jgi:hypothetical protein
MRHDDLVRRQEEEGDLLQDNARVLTLALADLWAHPQERREADERLKVAQEHQPGAARLVLLCELVDGCPRRRRKGDATCDDPGGDCSASSVGAAAIAGCRA